MNDFTRKKITFYFRVCPLGGHKVPQASQNFATLVEKSQKIRNLGFFRLFSHKNHFFRKYLISTSMVRPLNPKLNSLVSTIMNPGIFWYFLGQNKIVDQIFQNF